MRVMAVDPGARRFGVALSDGLGLTSRPLTTLDRERVRDIVGAVVDLIASEGAATVVIGVAVETDGGIGVAAQRALRFRDKLVSRLAERGLDVPVVTLDEAYSTSEAHSRLRERGLTPEQRKAVVDQEAAAVILEDYLRGRAAGEVR